MTDLKFAQPARRNLLAPVLIAFLILGIALALVLRYTPHRVADATITHTAIYPAHTNFNSSTIMVGRNQSQDDLYALVTVHVDNRLNLPLFLKDFTGTLVTADGQQIQGTAAEKQELETIYTVFPAMRALSSEPLLRETLINPENSAEGMVLLHFPVAQDVWTHRRSATLNIDLYHQGPLTIAIPQDNRAASSSATTTLEE